MKAGLWILAGLLAFLACEDDPTTLPPGESPTATFDLTRSNDTTILVDASASAAGAGSSTLWVRWDWQDDGVWDTEWSQTKTAAHDYGTEGTWTIRLEVGNETRRLDQTTHPVTVLRLLTPEKVIQGLVTAYRNMDRFLLADLLVDDPARNAEYVFLLSAPTDVGETQWGYAEEVRIHHRMFEPWSPPPGDPPVAAELWLQWLFVTLQPLEAFAERTDLYTTNGGPLDPASWRAVDARYSTYALFDLAGTDYMVQGAANFVVLEDLTKDAGDVGKFLLYIWEDIESAPNRAPHVSSTSSWSMMKALFR